jgi:adenylate cyclase
VFGYTPDEEAAEVGAIKKAAPDRPVVAVLPFNVFGGGQEIESLANGITEDVTTDLSRIGSFAVVARNTSSTYRGKPIHVTQVGREVGARYVIEGSVRQAGARIRVTTQLIETATGNHIWAERYDHAMEDSLDLQDDVTRSVVASAQTQIMLHEGDSIERSGKTSLSLAEQAAKGWAQLYHPTTQSLSRALHIGSSLIEMASQSPKGHQLVASAAYHMSLMAFTDDVTVPNKVLTHAR